MTFQTTKKRKATLKLLLTDNHQLYWAVNIGTLSHFLKNTTRRARFSPNNNFFFFEKFNKYAVKIKVQKRDFATIPLKNHFWFNKEQINVK